MQKKKTVKTLVQGVTATGTRYVPSPAGYGMLTK